METRRKNSKRARASTQDVLGANNAPAKRINPKWREYFDALVEMRERMLERRGVLVRDASEEQPAFSLHMADAATDAYDRDFALGMASSEQNALYEIDQALNRIGDGTYGVCELTGKPIEAERLKAIPWTRFSAAAEKEVGTVKPPKLGELAHLPDSSEPDRDEDPDEE